MKAMRTLLIIGFFGVLPATALSQPTNSVLSASAASSLTATTTNSAAQDPARLPKLAPATTYSTIQYQLVKPGVESKEGKDKIIRFGNESSQAWTTIASRQPNPTLVHNLSTHEPRFCLCSFGHDSW